MLRSANDKHPNGLANGSDQVGRNYMRHNMSVVMALLKEPNHTVFQKTLAVSDFYLGHTGLGLPARSHPDVRDLARRADPRRGAAARADEPRSRLDLRQDGRAFHRLLAPERGSAAPENRVSYRYGQVVLNVEQTNMEAAARLKAKLEGLLTPMNAWPALIDRDLYLGKGIPLSGTAHQAGTLRFGTDPATSVLDLDCKAHQLDNLYVTDASFFPSIGAVNPTLTIIANALRVAHAIEQRMGG